ncbi:hypothetical protein NPIL_19331 [Nephila pilipes]|uniref:Uncharacterized protein n=1 Tax=Nephila pilipes TaxID=299642 RepID=A0A8X6QN93_NEPPI|nr:hypothetical protein NPIL_19331 [Nephila pilipes]
MTGDVVYSLYRSLDRRLLLLVENSADLRWIANWWKFRCPGCFSGPRFIDPRESSYWSLRVSTFEVLCNSLFLFPDPWVLTRHGFVLFALWKELSRD